MTIKVTDVLKAQSDTGQPLRPGTYGSATVVAPANAIGALITVNIVQNRLNRLVDIVQVAQQQAESKSRQEKARAYYDSHRHRINGIGSEGATAENAATSTPKVEHEGGGSNFLENLFGFESFEALKHKLFGKPPPIGKLGIVGRVARVGILGWAAIGLSIWDMAESLKETGKVGGSATSLGASVGWAFGGIPGAVIGAGVGYIAGDTWDWFHSTPEEINQKYQITLEDTINKTKDDDDSFGKPAREWVDSKATAAWAGFQSSWNASVTKISQTVHEAYASFIKVLRDHKDRALEFFKQMGISVATFLEYIVTSMEHLLPDFDLGILMREWFNYLKDKIKDFVLGMMPKVGSKDEGDLPYSQQPDLQNRVTRDEQDEKAAGGVISQPEAARGYALSPSLGHTAMSPAQATPQAQPTPQAAGGAPPAPSAPATQTPSAPAPPSDGDTTITPDNLGSGFASPQSASGIGPSGLGPGGGGSGAGAVAPQSSPAASPISASGLGPGSGGRGPPAAPAVAQPAPTTTAATPASASQSGFAPTPHPVGAIPSATAPISSPTVPSSPTGESTSASASLSPIVSFSSSSSPPTTGSLGPGFGRTSASAAASPMLSTPNAASTTSNSPPVTSAPDIQGATPATPPAAPVAPASSTGWGISAGSSAAPAVSTPQPSLFPSFSAPPAVTSSPDFTTPSGAVSTPQAPPEASSQTSGSSAYSAPMFDATPATTTVSEAMKEDNFTPAPPSYDQPDAVTSLARNSKLSDMDMIPVTHPDANFLAKHHGSNWDKA